MKKRFWIPLVLLSAVALCIAIFALRTAYDKPESAEEIASIEKIQLLGKLRADWFYAGGTFNETEAVRAGANDSAVHLLFLGIDRRAKERGRSDAIHILRFEPGQIVLFSIPRDAMVSIRGDTRPDKLNHSYAYGGHALTIRTIEDLLKIKIDGYLEVDLNSFVRLAKIAKVLTMNGKLVGAEELFAHIDGWLSWLRNRSMPGGDFRRIARQQLFITKSLDWTLSLYNNHPSVFANAARAVLSMSPTDITYHQVLALCQIYSGMPEVNPKQNKFADNPAISRMERFVMPARPVMIDTRTGKEIIMDTEAKENPHSDSEKISVVTNAVSYNTQLNDSSIKQFSEIQTDTSAIEESNHILSFCIIENPFDLNNHLIEWRRSGIWKNYEDRDELFGNSK